MQNMKHVAITTGLKSTIAVDGEDLTDKVEFIAFQVQPNEMPVVSLGLKGVVEFEGEAEVVYVAQQSFGEMFDKFVASLDLDHMSEVALEDDEAMTGRNPVLNAYLKYLKEAAHGRD